MDKKYRGLSEDQFNAMNARYKAFHDAINDPTKDPVRVFNPLSKKNLDELVLAREVSKDLQMKKEEDIKKQAAQAAQVAEPEEHTEQQEEKTN